MEGQWRVAKVLNNGEYHIEFQRFYINEKRVQDKNRIVVYKNNLSHMTMAVHNAFGNYYYGLLKGSADGWDTLLDTCYLDMCAFYDEYDAYSDTFKDIYGVRPRYTTDQWDALVREARKRGY